MDADYSPTLTPPAPAVSGFLGRRVAGRLTITGLLLIAITALAAFLYLANAGALANANTYYTAAVTSMLQSWRNFFFVAAEPGGSVTVDKPPLGLWIQAAFAAVLGVSGFVVSLPNILAGVASVPLLFHLVRRWFGRAVGLLAALVLAITPVAIAAARNNTADAMLTFALLLAAWAFLNATESGRLRYLWLGAIIVGLAFNIKMLQAFLPLPAFYALYFLAARVGWGRKLLHLVATTALLLAVSLSWALVVDLTPAEQRPYVGSSSDNSVLSLIIGYNGLQRLTGTAAPGGQIGPPAGPGAGNTSVAPATSLPVAAGAPPGAPRALGGPLGGETGVAGPLRFFQIPLAKELSWLLPLALLDLLMAATARPWRSPLASPYHKGLVLWGGWLVAGLVFFSIAGFYHAYYLIMLAPPLAAAVAMGARRWWAIGRSQPRRAAALLVLATAATVAYQVWLARNLAGATPWLLTPIGLLLMGGALLLRSLRRSQHPAAVGALVLLAALLTVPLAWSLLTTFDDAANPVLPSAYAGGVDFAFSGAVPLELPPGQSPPGVTMFGGAPEPGANEELRAFLEANTGDTEYLVAVPSAMMGAPLVLATGRPVLYMGGFSGEDRVVDAADLARLVDEGRLRYVLGGMFGRPEIDEWLAATCQAVEGMDVTGGMGMVIAAPGAGGSLPSLPAARPRLYDCAAGQ